MVLRYIGYGTTNANGIAKLDHDAEGNEIDGYTGTGAGNITFVASTDASPSSSSIMSNHVNVYDAPAILSIVLSLSQSTVNIGDTVTLSATVTENSEAVAGETVTFKRGNTAIGSSVTDSNGVATYSYTTDVSGVLSIIASCLGSNSASQSLTVIKINTSLSINVPQMIYTDNFNITSVLLDENNNPIENANIKLYAKYFGVEHLEATEQTDANGEVTFTRTTPTTINSYEFWVVFDGDNTYNNSISSKEQKSPDKETSVLAITSPLNNSSHYKPLDMSMGLNIVGTLKTNDGESIDLVGIDVLENGTKLGSLSVVNGTINGYVQWNKLPAGSHTLDFVFNGNSVYTGTTQTVTVNILNQSITLTGDNPILSYADSTQQNPQICTVTATFNGINPTQQSLKVYDENDTFIADMTNNGDGTYSYEYESRGVGDVELTVKDGSFLTKTYSIRDVHFYDSMTSDSGHWTYDSAITKSYSSDGVSITASTDKSPVCDVALPQSFRVTLKAKSNANNDVRYCVVGNWSITNGTYLNTPRLMLLNTWPPNYYVNNTYTSPNVVEFEAEYNNGVLTVKKDGATLITQAVTLADQVLRLYTGANHTMTIKDIIVEEL